MENAATTVVLRCHSPDGELQDRPGGGTSLSFGSTPSSEPLAGECSKVVFIAGINMPRQRVWRVEVQLLSKKKPGVTAPGACDFE